MAKQLPSEFIKLNAIVREFNTGLNVKVLGVDRYLLLQGSRVKSYSLHIVKHSDKRVVKTIVVSSNAKGIELALDILNRLSMPDSKYHLVKVD